MPETITAEAWDINNGNVDLFLQILNLYRFGTTEPSEYFGDHIRPFDERSENDEDIAPPGSRSVVQFNVAQLFSDTGPLIFFEPHQISGAPL